MRLLKFPMQTQRLLEQVARMAHKYGERGPELRTFWEKEMQEATEERTFTLPDAKKFIQAVEVQQAALEATPPEWEPMAQRQGAARRGSMLLAVNLEPGHLEAASNT